MTSFVRAELASRRRMIAALSLGACALILIVALAYKSFGAGALGSFFHSRSPRALTALSGSPNSDLFSPHGWMGFGFNHPLFLVITLTVAIGIGSGSIAGEVDSGRGELIFPGPIARSRFLWAYVAVWLVSETAVVAAGGLGALIGGALSPPVRNAGLGALLWAPVQYLPLAAFVAACAFLASALSKTRGKAMGMAISVAVLAYLVNVVSGLIGSLAWLRWLSPFGYYDPAAAIDHGVRWASTLPLIGAAAVLMALAQTSLNRRDLA